MSKRCHQCGEEWIDKRSPGFREECLKCGSPLHCCANCRFYDDSAREWCREPQARPEKPRDREAGNTCEYFLFGEESGEGNGERERKARENLAALFGDSPEKENKDGDIPDWMKPG